MIPTLPQLACRALLGLALANTPAHADSLASSASSTGSAASGSASDSIQGSSNSSSGERRVAEGDYRVIDIAELPARPGMLRLRLQATDDAARAFWLTLPRQALAAPALTRGDVVRASRRPYGLAFARTAAPEPFYLVLADDWQDELASNPVTR